jgi:hypothetical protein
MFMLVFLVRRSNAMFFLCASEVMMCIECDILKYVSITGVGTSGSEAYNS